MKLLLIFISTIYLQSIELEPTIIEQSEENLFITDYEYGQMLYKNPRGIGCIKCHGKDGQKKFIARYTHKDKIYEIYASAINNITLSKFRKKLKSKSKSKSIMPTYFLTNDEINSIHTYITSKQILH
jgi:cytochrome c553